MLKTLFTIIGLFFLIIVPTYSISNIEPSVQCTIIKVYETVQILGFTKFPELYQSINNDPTKSTLIIAEKKFTNLIPKTISKTEIFEKILIKHKPKIIVIDDIDRDYWFRDFINGDIGNYKYLVVKNVGYLIK